MSTLFQHSRVAVAAMGLALGALTGISAAADVELSLSGAHEVPPVQTSASGQGVISVGDDLSVSGSVTTTGVAGTMAHIHQAAAGENGPIIIPLEKKSDGEWSVPAGARLTDAQYKAYKDGGLYVNVHSDAHKGGEIRDQIKP